MVPTPVALTAEAGICVHLCCGNEGDKGQASVIVTVSNYIQ